MLRAYPVLLALAACSEPGGDARIECRLGEAGGFQRVCILSDRESERGHEMIVRRPDGGFRRLLGTAAGVEAADGAERPQVRRIADGRIEVDFGGDAYRLPPRGPE